MTSRAFMLLVKTTPKPAAKPRDDSLRLSVAVLASISLAAPDKNMRSRMGDAPVPKAGFS